MEDPTLSHPNRQIFPERSPQNTVSTVTIIVRKLFCDPESGRKKTQSCPLAASLLWLVILLPCATKAAMAQQAQVESEDVFKAAVRTTKPLTPQQELATFQVPDGFEVSLFASEPRIQKPLNMAFDADGRLWLTCSTEYPYPVKDGEGQDSIRILEDTNGDGVADTVTVFADDLNIPMGLYPYRDGVVVFSIPNILFLRDTDGDGKADSREVLYGPFDTTRDTHGMNNAFRRGFDGWLYCCHGFNNQSQVAGTDGHSVSMNSGNTYRIRLDGSRIEHLTHGQVNPFGMTIDANGDLFNSDCHTKPVSLLLRGGYYESFGKPHDGLGYVPPVMDHLHGSTAIDALCQYQDTVFPEEFRDDIFVGNVMTSRIHRNSIVRTGSTVRMQEEADFLTSTDPWFRPVDIQIGHDGAMYIADFYNRIIGHYEVPLDHPGRDRTSGRIWRVAYVGDSKADSAVDQPKLSELGLGDLLGQLTDDRKFIRQHAADQIVDRLGSSLGSDLDEQDAMVTEVLAALEVSLNTNAQTAAPQLLWILQRLGKLSVLKLQDVFDRGVERTRIHVMRVCSEYKVRKDVLPLVLKGLRDSKALVQRAAADAAAQNSTVDLAKEVVNAMVVCPAQDVHLKHALKIALKHQIQDPEVAQWFSESVPPQSACEALSQVVSAVESEAAGGISLKLLQSGHLNTEQLEKTVAHVARNLTSESANELFELAKALPDNSISLKTSIWLAMSKAIRNRNLESPEDFQEWSSQLAMEQLSSADVSRLSWGHYSVGGLPPVEWGRELRSVPRNPQAQQFLSSLVGGEKGVGLIRSRPFVMPFNLEIQVCGHLGSPKELPSPENRVILRDLETGHEIESVLAPRSDVATVHKWSCGQFAGREGYLEVVDGLSLESYAWIAIGRPVPMVVKGEVQPSADAEMLLSAINILRDQVLSGMELTSVQLQLLVEIAKVIQVDGELRAVAAETLLLHQKKSALVGMADLLRFAETPRVVDAAVAQFCSIDDSKAAKLSATTGNGQQAANRDLGLVKNVFSQLDVDLRNRLVQKLVESKQGSELLLASMESGVPSASVLRDGRLVAQLSGYGESIAARVAALVDSLPKETTDTTTLSQNVVSRIKLGEGDAQKGLAVYEKNCMNCHRRKGVGGVAGPQLDGVATRGTARMLEDILHPNRNVDVAFRTSTLQLKSGKVMTGIVRPGNSAYQLMVMTSDGKLIEVANADVEERKDSTLSLMPGNVANLLSEDQLLDLVKFLLQ